LPPAGTTTTSTTGTTTSTATTPTATTGVTTATTPGQPYAIAPYAITPTPTTTAPTVTTPTPTTPTTTTPADLGGGLTSPTGGGGQVGLLALSSYIQPNTTDVIDYFNHYSLLTSIATLFKVKRLG